MVNKYIYTKDMVKEYENAWWNNEFKVGNISIAAIMMIATIVVIQQGIKKTFSIPLIVLLVVSIIYFIMLFIKKKISIKNELKRYEKAYGDKGQEVKIRLDNSIKIISDKNETEVSYDKIEKYIQTKNLIILLVKGDMTIALKKGAFGDSTDEECKKVLDKKIKKSKKTRRKICIKRGKN